MSLDGFSIIDVFVFFAAKECFYNAICVKKSSGKDAKKREYSKKELDSLFDDIEEVEI